MKIKIKEFTGNLSFLSHIILDCANKAAIKTVTDIEDRNEDTEIDIEFKFNGIDLDIRKFTTHLEEAYDSEVKKKCRPEAIKMFEEMKHTFKSKNSPGAKLSKINEQIQKANHQLINIQKSINHLDYE